MRFLSNLLGHQARRGYTVQAWSLIHFLAKDYSISAISIVSIANTAV